MRSGARNSAREAEGQCGMRSSAIHQEDPGQTGVANISLSACTRCNPPEPQSWWGLPYKRYQLLQAAI